MIDSGEYWPDAKLVDTKILLFGQWRREIEKEDVKEFGGVIYRPDLPMLYSMYKNFNNSDKAIAERNRRLESE